MYGWYRLVVLLLVYLRLHILSLSRGSGMDPAKGNSTSSRSAVPPTCQALFSTSAKCLSSQLVCNGVRVPEPIQSCPRVPAHRRQPRIRLQLTRRFIRAETDSRQENLSRTHSSCPDDKTTAYPPVTSSGCLDSTVKGHLCIAQQRGQ